MASARYVVQLGWLARADLYVGSTTSRSPTRAQQPRQMLKLPSAGLLRARAGACRGARRGTAQFATFCIAARRLIFTRGDTAGERAWKSWELLTAPWAPRCSAVVAMQPCRVADAAGVVDRIVKTAGAARSANAADAGILRKDLTDAVGPAANATTNKTNAKTKNEGLPPMIRLRCESD